ncbi:L-2-amino-thiazoline-4-carboxylic acid hydrolase [Alteribacter populi]|uniref:L-2-amino-thiazoline-4-carboxylic acid hydrolase n=1 Tax=Alteribacter populi TaxID=2011011 RepID=UPI001FDFEBB7|nr:L-2-amino-thiazoline-4-carboxylic acid hydrolase [Alteribacter populi]
MTKQPSDQVENLEPTTMFEITAKLFKHVKASVKSSFSDKGDLAIKAGVQALIEDQKSNLITRAMKEKGSLPEIPSLTESTLFNEETLASPNSIESTFENYRDVQKRAGIEPFTMYAMMAKVFAHVSKAVSVKFGEEGKEAVMEGVRTFGEERGRDIKRRAAEVGEPNGKDNYLSNYDMGRSELFEFETHFHPTEIEQTFTKCAFADQWMKDGMEEHGILYCHMIDPAVAKGFNPNFEVIHDQYVLKEGVCHFRFQLKEEK